MSAQVVDFVGLRFLNDAGQVAAIAEVAIVQLEAGVVDVWVLVDVVYALGVERAGAAFDAVHDIAFFKQEFGKVGTVLAGDAGDEGDFWGVQLQRFLAGNWRAKTLVQFSCSKIALFERKIS